MKLQIRKAKPEDFEELWQIIRVIIQAGDTYIFSPDTKKDVMQTYWMGTDKLTYIALWDKQVVGTYFIKANQPDLGSHIANAGFMVSPDFAGKGIGYELGKHALEEAQKAGFLAMQFNMVVSTNVSAIHLWQKLGFEIIGTIPKAFQHQNLGLVDALVMYRVL